MRVLDCGSLSLLTLPLQMCDGCLLEQGLGRGKALAEAPCSYLGSNLPFAEGF